MKEKSLRTKMSTAQSENQTDGKEIDIITPLFTVFNE